MSRRLFLALFLFASCAPIAVRTPPEPSRVEVSDAQIAADIAWAIRDIEGWEGIQITVANGDVLLQGRCGSDAGADDAVVRAGTVPGVRSVTERIKRDG